MQNSSVMEMLAKRYNQLYITPEAGISETGMYYDIVTGGKVPPELSGIMSGGLTGFFCSDKDEYYTESTPAGDIEILYLCERADFERFLQIMVYRCEPVKISSSVSIAEISGVTNWRKIEDHMKEYFISGGELSERSEELQRFKSNREASQDRMVIATSCCYSGLSADQAGFSDEEWKKISLSMNIHNSCSRIIMRKMYPEVKNAFAEELFSDCIGMMFATGHYDTVLAKKILGIDPCISQDRFRFSDYCRDNHINPAGLVSKLSYAVGKISEISGYFCSENSGDYYGLLIFLIRNVQEITKIFG